MGESFTIQISNTLVNQLIDEGEKSKKKTRKPKPKSSRESPRSQSKPSPPKPTPNAYEPHTEKTPNPGFPIYPPLYLPVPPAVQQPLPSELEAIRSVLRESEKVVERLQNQEEAMLKEVTERAKDLHDKEFKLPYQRPLPCLTEKNACFECYTENIKYPLKCASLVKSFADCARKARQQMSSPAN